MAEHIDDQTLERCRLHLWRLQQELATIDQPGDATRSALNALRYLTPNSPRANGALRMILSVLKGVAYDDTQTRKLIQAAYQRGLDAPQTKEESND